MGKSTIISTFNSIASFDRYRCLEMFFFSIPIFILESDNLVDVEVEFDYEAELSDELSLKTGDIIENVKRMDGGWWEGSLNGKKGVFPDNFVKVRRVFFLIWVLTFSIILLQNK